MAIRQHTPIVFTPDPPPVDGKKSVTGRANSGSAVDVATCGTDPQLERAIKEVMDRLGKQTTANAGVDVTRSVRQAAGKMH